MENTNWLKQTADKPLFPDLLWSRPENKRQAGKLLIIGGSVDGFAAPASAFSAATKAGVGIVRVLLPDSTRKVLGTSFAEAEFTPSTPNGSFSRQALAQLLENAQWADGVLLAGDFGRNSETAILLDSFLEKYTGLVTVAQDGLDYFWGPASKLLSRPETLSVINLGKLQKLAKNNRPSTPVLHSMNLHELVTVLADWTNGISGSFITKHADNLVAAAGGKVSTTPIETSLSQGPRLDGVQGDGEQRTEVYDGTPREQSQPATPQSAKSTSGAAGSAGRQAGAARSLGNWQVDLAAYASVWQLQQPTKPFEAMASAVHQYLS